MADTAQGDGCRRLAGTLARLVILLCCWYGMSWAEEEPHPEIVKNCTATDAQLDSLIPEEKRRNEFSWFQVPEAGPVNLPPVPKVPLPEVLQYHQEPPASIPGASSINLRVPYYELSYFCITPQNNEGLIFYGQESDGKVPFTICNDFPWCHEYMVTFKTSPPPSDVKWITSSTALIDLFTLENAWHMSQHFLAMHHLMHSPEFKFINNDVHFHPSLLPIPKIRHLQYILLDVAPEIDLFTVEHFPLWPLLSTTVPEHIKMIILNVLYDRTYDPSNVPKVCYQHGYLVGNFSEFHMMALQHNDLHFGDIYPYQSVLRFKHDILQRTGALHLTSGWCPGPESKRERPILGLILRKRERRICNPGEVIRWAEEMGFEVQLIRLESISIVDQIKSIRLSDLMVGVHGAGLLHVIWMRYGSGMLEMYPYGGFINHLTVDKNSSAYYGAISVSSGATHATIGEGIETREHFFRNYDTRIKEENFKNVLGILMASLKRRRTCD